MPPVAAKLLMPRVTGLCHDCVTLVSRPLASVTRDIVLPVALVSLHTPPEAGLTLAPVGRALGALVIHGAAPGVREVTLAQGAGELLPPPGP